MIRPAPASRAPWIAAKPTPPQPITSTLSPGRTAAVRMHRADSGGDAAAQQRSEVEGQCIVDRHHRRGRQQRLFGQRPDAHRRPHRPGGALGVRRAVGVVVAVQAQLGLTAQAVRARPAGTFHVSTTWSPGLTVVTSSPTSVTIPAPSCPSVRGQQRRYRPVAQRQVAVAHAAGAQLHPYLMAAERPQREFLHRGGPSDLAQHDSFHAAALIRMKSVIAVIASYDGGTPALGQGCPFDGRRRVDDRTNDDHAG